MGAISSSLTNSSSAIEPTADALEAATGRVLAAGDAAARRAALLAALDQHPADPFLDHLKAASERLFTVNAQDSLRLADALIEAAELADRPRHRALGLLARGDALRTLGRYQEAHDTFEAAGAAFLDIGDEVGWARTRTGWVTVSYFLGRGADALCGVGAAHDVLIAHGESLRAAGLDQNTAVVCYFLGRYDEALTLYDRAHGLLRALGSVAEERAAWVTANKAMVLTLLGEFDEALALHEEARRVFVRCGATLSVLRQDQFIADVYVSQGRYTEALRLYADALDAFDRQGDETHATWVSLNMIDCYLRLNRAADALALAEETAIRAERCGAPIEQAKAHFACALALGRLGEHERALLLLDSAAGMFAATDHASDAANAHLLRAGLHLGDEAWALAIGEAERASAHFAARKVVVRRAQAELIRARALLGLGDGAAAEAVVAATLAEIAGRDLPWLAHECHHIRARVAQSRGDCQAVLAECDAALAAIEQVQRWLTGDWRGDFLADKLAVYHDALNCCLHLSPPDPERAFAYLERAKSRALVEYLANNPGVRAQARDPDDQAIAGALHRLRAEHDWFYDRLYGFGYSRREGAVGQGSSEEEALVLREQIRTRERQIGRLVERLDLRQAGGAAGITTPALSSAQVRSQLDGQTLLLEYALNDQGGAIFVLTRHSLAVVPLGLSLGQLQRRLNLWQLSLAASARALAEGQPLAQLGANARGHLHALYRLLIAPVAAHLAGYQRLIIIPSGPLHQLPFHALHDGERFLIERHELVTCPSSNLLALCMDQPRRGGGSVLIVANSDQGRLPAVAAEAQGVAALLPTEAYLERSATREAVIAAAPRHPIVHLAAHAEARLDNPIFAHLKLADGQLTTQDVIGLDLRGSLVVLSGCETGRAAVRGGDELIGLSRAFLHAGASTLVQSLWRVEDRSTAELMRRFYLALAAGEPKGAALRAAQLALLEEQQGNPYLWAAFQLVGAYGRA